MKPLVNGLVEAAEALLARWDDYLYLAGAARTGEGYVAEARRRRDQLEARLREMRACLDLSPRLTDAVVGPVVFDDRRHGFYYRSWSATSGISESPRYDKWSVAMEARAGMLCGLESLGGLQVVTAESDAVFDRLVAGQEGGQ